MNNSAFPPPPPHSLVFSQFIPAMERGANSPGPKNTSVCTPSSLLSSYRLDVTVLCSQLLILQIFLILFCLHTGSPTSAESVTSGYSGSATERTSPGPAPGSPVASVKFGPRSTRSSPLYGSLKKVLKINTMLNFIFSLRLNIN